MVSPSDIKSEFAFNILDELSQHHDGNGNFAYIPLNNIVDFLKKNNKIGSSDIEVSKVKRLVTDMDRPLGLLDSGHSGDYSLNGKGLAVLENWRDEYGKPKVDKAKLRRV